jgi:arylsulfatase A-like enzyme
MDTDIGRIADLVEALGLGNNTLILFSSDNGPEGDKGCDSNGPFRGGKRDLYEGAIRVPVIAYQPGVIAPGAQSDLQCAFWDMMPTFAELGGTNTPTPIDGISIVPTLNGNTQTDRHEYLFWKGEGKMAVRMGNWKAVRVNNTIELYDLSVDIGESKNTASGHSDIVSQMTAIMSEANTQTVVPQWNPLRSTKPAIGHRQTGFSVSYLPGDGLHCFFPDAKPYRISVIDSEGRTRLMRWCASKRRYILPALLPAGLYLVRADSKSARMARMLTVMR